MTETWVEPRGPHLPDRLMRIPLGTWPFLALTAAAGYEVWDALRMTVFDHPLDVWWAVVGSVRHIVAPLIGAALFYRHPSARLVFPALTVGVALFGLTTVAAALRAPVMDGIGASDMAYDAALLAGTGYTLVEALFMVFAITYLANGLGAARRWQDGSPARGAQALLVVAALAASAVTGWFAWSSGSNQAVLLIAGVTAFTLTNLAWAYLGWTGYRGWAAGEEPRLGWGLIALAGIGYVAVNALYTFLSAVVWVIGPTDGPIPVVYEVGQLLGVALAAFWICILAAFVIGLPAEDQDEDVEGRGMQDEGTPQPV